MTSPEPPELRRLITRKAALTRHRDPGDPELQAVASELRLAVIRLAIQELDEAEKAELAALLAVA